MTLEIRKAILNDRETIGKFLENVFPNKRRYPERWDWLNVNNPFLTKNIGLPEWLAILDNDIVGHQGAMPVSVKINDKSIIVAWSIDTIVTEVARGLGIAKTLTISNQSEYPMFISVEYTNTNRHVKLKTGSQEGPPVSLLYRMNHILPSPLYSDILISARQRLGIIGYFIASFFRYTGLINVMCWLLKKLKKDRKPNADASSVNTSLSLEPVELFDNRADTLWQTIRSQFTFSVERTSTYLNWKYFKQPHMKHQCFYVKNEHEVIGVLVIRIGTAIEQSIGVICECYLKDSSSAAYSWLIQQSVNILTGQGAAGIWSATAEKYIEDLYVQNGFFCLRKNPLLFHFTDDVGKNFFERALISKGDHDWDQYPKLKQPHLKQLMMILGCGCSS